MEVAGLLADRHPHEQQGCRYSGSSRNNSEQVAHVFNPKEEEDPFLKVTACKPESRRPKDVGLQVPNRNRGCRQPEALQVQPLRPLRP